MLHHVGPHEQRLVAHHRVIEQDFVADARLFGEPVAIMEIHPHRGEGNRRARILGLEEQRHRFIRRDAHHQPVGAQAFRRIVAEQALGRALEPDGNLRHARGQMLAGAQEEGHARPPPIVDFHMDRGIGLDGGIRRDARFPAIRRKLALRIAAILPAHGAIGRNRGNCGQHLRLLRAHILGGEADRRLHGDQRQQTEHMIGHHVAQRAGALVEIGPALDPHSFGGGNLHVVDALAIPERLEDPVGETERQDILHRFLAEKVINAKHLRFVHRSGDLGVKRPCGGKIVPKGLFDHHPAPAAAALLG